MVSQTSLLKFISDQGLVASPEEQLKRSNLIDELKQILITWIKRVAYQRRLPFKDASAAVIPFGSYGLDVYNVDSNIDLLCLVPFFASIPEDFFIVLLNMLAGRPQVSGIHSVKGANFPLLRFTFDGILIYLTFAKLQLTAVTENVDIFNPSLVKDIDETSCKSLSGLRLNNRILQLVPDVKIFQELLRCVKSWAKRRGVYSDVFGLFGGVHLTVLAAFICMKNPSTSLVDLISIFFKTFAFWPWPEPVVLEDGATPFAPPLPTGTRALMPMRFPSSPDKYCHSNMTTSTFNKIRSEFRRGYRLTQDLLKPHFVWGNLFEPFPYSKSYLSLIKICLSTYNQDELATWVHWVKSRICSLLVKLEELHAFCDPNPREYTDVSLEVPNVVFYWGLVPGRGDNLNLDIAKEEFMKILSNGYQGGSLGGLTLTMVQASQLPQTLELADSHIKAQLKSNLVNHHQQPLIPVYSVYSPQYVVGYLATDGYPEHPHGVDLIN